MLGNRYGLWQRTIKGLMPPLFSIFKKTEPPHGPVQQDEGGTWPGGAST
jgi:hypothetical protein